MIAFDHPYWLLGIVPVLAFLLIAQRTGYVDAPRWRRRLSFFLRALILGAFLAALALPYLQLTSKKKYLLFVLDISESVSIENKLAVLKTVDTITEKGDGDTRFALMVLAGKRELLAPWTDRAFVISDDARRKILYQSEVKSIRQRIRSLSQDPTEKNVKAIAEARAELKRIKDWQQTFGTRDTDLEGGLRFARALFPMDGQKRILLFSDGNENLGEIAQGLPALVDENISVSTHLLKARDAPELMLTDLVVPAAVKVKQPFDVEVHAHSNVESEADLSLYLDDFRHRRRRVTIKKGDNVFTFRRLSVDGGLHKFEAVAEVTDPALDTRAENNRVLGVCSVRGKPKVLYIHGDNAEDAHQSHWIRDALEEEGITFGEDGVRPSAGIPEDLEGFLNFDIVIFENVPSTRLTRAQMSHIKTYVQRFGGGFIMIGGEESFGLGGYYKTPIEEILPVRMLVEKDLEKTNLAMVLVIDKSGSMSGNKIQLAKESAIASAEVLQPMDEIGVVAFDSQAKWIVEMTRASNIHQIARDIATLEAGGGTHIYPGMKKAGEALDNIRAQQKLLIVLSDGHTTGNGHRRLAARLAADGITVSTVGIGDGADRELLTDIAEEGGGRSYFTNNFFNLPRIFTKETLRVSKSMLIEEPITPRIETFDQVIRGIDEFPSIYGYVVTTPRSGATTPLISAEYGDPLLAKWRYGLGWTAAFTSSTHSKWVADWQSDDWPYFTKFWGQLVRGVMSTGTHNKVQVEVTGSIRKRRARLLLDFYTIEGAYVNDLSKSVKLFKPDGSAAGRPVDQLLHHSAPGRYEVNFPIDQVGAFYRLLLDQPKYDFRRVFAFIQSYPDEYKQLAEQPELLARIAGGTHGDVDPTPEAVLSFPTQPAFKKSVWPWFLIFGLLLLPVDILCRRL